MTGRRVVVIDHVARPSGAELAMARTVGAMRRWTPHVVLGEHGPLVEVLRAAGVEVEVLRLPTRSRDMHRGALARGLPFGPAAGAAVYSLRLARRIRRLDADVVHLNSLKAGLYGGVAARLAGTPAIWHARDRVAGDSLPAPAIRLVRLAARWLPAGLIANSDATMATLRPPRHHAVIPSPVDPALLELDRQEHDGCTIIMVGRLSPWKGQRVFLGAFALAFGADEPVRGRLVGDALFGEEDYAAELAGLVDELGLAGQVELVGFRADVAAELAASDILVHCSVEPEPFGVVVLEGMAAGLAVVASEVGGPAEIVTPGVDGILVPPGDPAALAAVLRALAADPDRRARLGAAGRARAAAFTPARVAAEVEALYDVVMARPPRRSSGALGYVGRPDVRRRLAVHVAHRLRFEIERRLAPARLEAPRAFTLPDGVHVTAPLDDVIGRALYVYGAYEFASLRLFEDLVPAGGVVVDGGAHLGNYTLRAGHLVGPSGRVLAFEPNRPVRELLERSVRRNRFDHVRVLPWGLGDVEGEASLVASGDATNSGMTRLAAGGAGPSIRIRPLDAVLDEEGVDRLDVVKLDVEGWEPQVLAGAARAIERWMPAILFEVNETVQGPGGWSAPVIDELRARGYRIHRLGDRPGRAGLVELAPGEDPRGYAEPWHALNLVALA